MSLSAGVAAGKRRAWLVAVVSGALLVAVVVGALALHGAAGLPLPGLTGAPALLPGAINRVYLDSDAPWATVTLDGHAITPPVIGQQPPLTLAPGAHIIRWIAAPFNPQSCVLSIPAARDDTCQLSTEQVVTLPHQPTAQLVYLEESLATLSSSQQTALKQAIQAALPGYTTTAQPGEAYLAYWNVASQPLKMTLGESLYADASGYISSNGGCFFPFDTSAYDGCNVDGRNCVRLCTLPWSSRALLPSPDPHAWYAFAMANLMWSVSAPDGRSLVSNWSMALESANQPPSEFDPVLLRMQWLATRWNVKQVVGAALPRQLVISDGQPISDDPACLDAYGLITGVSDAVGFNSGAIKSYTQARFISGPNPADGCLVEVTVGIPGKPPASGAPVAKFLDRFSMVYPLNRVDAPSLLGPHAYINETTAIQQQAAKSLAAYPGQLYVFPANAGNQGL